MYSLDTEAAKQADQKGGAITEKGKYLGVFTRAENIKSEKGTVGVEFSFRSDSGLGADYLTLWTKNADGKQLYGYKTLMAIMTCLKVKNIAPVRKQIEKYDHNSGSRIMMDAEVFPELMDKPIGLLINMEEYERRDSTTNWKPSIYAPFSSDGFVATEILNKSTIPELLGKMELSMRDRPLKNHTQSIPNQPPVVDFDGDIPF